MRPQDCKQILVPLVSKLCDSLAQHGLVCVVELLSHSVTLGVIGRCIHFPDAQKVAHI